MVPPCFSDRTSITLHSQPFSGVRRSPLLSASRIRLGGEFGTKRAGLHRVHLDRQLSEFRFGCLLLLLYATSLSVVIPVRSVGVRLPDALMSSVIPFSIIPETA